MSKDIVNNVNELYDNNKSQINMILNNIDDVQNKYKKINNSNKDISSSLQKSLHALYIQITSIKSISEELKSLNISNVLKQYNDIQKNMSDELSLLNDHISMTLELKDAISNSLNDLSNDKLKQSISSLLTSLNSCFSNIHFDTLSTKLNDIHQYTSSDINVVIPNDISKLNINNIQIINENDRQTQLNIQLLINQLNDYEAKLNDVGTYASKFYKSLNDNSKVGNVVGIGAKIQDYYQQINDIKQKLNSSDSHTTDDTIIESISLISEQTKSLVSGLVGLSNTEGLSNDKVLYETILSVLETSEMSMKQQLDIVGRTNVDKSKSEIDKEVSELQQKIGSLLPLIEHAISSESKVMHEMLVNQYNNVNERNKHVNDKDNNGSYVDSDATRLLTKHYFSKMQPLRTSTNEKIINDVQFRKTSVLKNDKEFLKIRRDIERDIIGTSKETNKFKIGALYNDGHELESLKGLSEILLHISDKQIESTSLLNISKHPVLPLTQDDKKIVQDVILSINGTTKNLTILSEILSRNNADEGLLKVINNKRNALLNISDSLKSSISTTSSLEKMFSFIKGNSILSTVSTGLGIMGLGTVGMLFHPTQYASAIFDRYTQNGLMKQQLSLSDASMGLGIDEQANEDIYFNLGQKYFQMTFGEAGFNVGTQFYSSIVKNVGGHYGESNYDARNDIHSLTSSLLSPKILYDISDNTMNSFLKTFYKDLGLSAGDAASAFSKLILHAHDSSVPVEQYVNIVSQLSDSLRTLGVNAAVVESSVHGVQKISNMTIEDSSSIVSSTANAAQSMGSDWGRSLFFGMMNGKFENPFSTIETGMSTYDANGKPNDNYYSSMVDRLMTEAQFYGGMGGLETPQGRVMMMSTLSKQGYTQKDTPIIMNLIREGKTDELIKKLKGIDEENDPLSHVKKLEDSDALLSKTAKELAENQKTEADLAAHINAMSLIVDKYLGSPLNDFAKWIDKTLQNFSKFMESALSTMMGIFNSKIFQMGLNSFKDSPFLTTAGVFAGAASLKMLGGYLLKKSINISTTGLSKVLSTSSSKLGGNKKLLSLLAIPAMTAAFSSTSEASAREDNDGNNEGNNDSNEEESYYSQLADDVQNGDAKITLLNTINDSMSSDGHHENVSNLQEILSLGAVAGGGYGIKKWMDNSKRMQNFKYKGVAKSALGNIGLATFLNVLSGKQSGADLAKSILADSIGYMSGEMIGKTAGSLIGRFFGPYSLIATPVLSFAGGLAGQYFIGDKVSTKLKEMMGVSEDGSASSDGNDVFSHGIKQYSDAARVLGMSNEEFNALMKMHLEAHGMDLSKLDESQKLFWAKKVLDYMSIYNNLATALSYASRSLKVNSGGGKLSFDKDGKPILNDEEKTKIYGDVKSQWDNDDSTKANWYERRANEEDDEFKKSIFSYVSMYYNHTNDDTSDESWQNIGNVLQAYASDGGELGQKWSMLFEEWLKHDKRKGDFKHSSSLLTADINEIKEFLRYVAIQNYDNESKNYFETVGYEKVQARIDELRKSQFQNVNINGATGSNVAQAVSQLTGLRADFILMQMIHETGNFSSDLAQHYHNYSGMRGTGTGGTTDDGYAIYNNDADFARAYANTLANYREDGLYEATTIEEWALALKRGGYYTADVSEYVNGLRGAAATIGMPSSLSGPNQYVNAANGVFYQDITDYQYSGMTTATKQFINALTSRFYAQTGVKVHLSSGYRPDDTGSYHSEGIAFDVWADEFDNNADLRAIYTNMAAEMGGTPLDEYPGAEGEQYAQGNNIHVSVHNQDFTYSGPGGAINGRTINVQPETVSQTTEKNINNYNALMQKMGAHTIKGKIVNEMSVDASQKFESIDEINKLVTASIDDATRDTSTATTSNELNRVNNSISQSYDDDFVVMKKQSWGIIMKQIEEVAKKYMDNPEIVANCDYK